jgi:pullulanase/glycogen debranching enzyme
VEGTAFDDNSYRSPDMINSLKWDQLHTNKEVVDYYKGLIALRRKHRLLRLSKAEEIRVRLRFLDWSQPNVVSFLLADEKEELCIIYNANKESKEILIPEGDWKVYVKGTEAGTEVKSHHPGGGVLVEAISALLMIQYDRG